MKKEKEKDRSEVPARFVYIVELNPKGKPILPSNLDYFGTRQKAEIWFRYHAVNQYGMDPLSMDIHWYSTDAAAKVTGRPEGGRKNRGTQTIGWIYKRQLL